MSGASGRRALLLAAAGLGGCTLIDQRTFNPQAGAPPPVAKPPTSAEGTAAESGPPPLLVIRLPAAGDVRGEVAKAVAAARARKPDVVFDVVELTSGSGATVGAEAEEVARMITAQGVPQSRVRLAARPTAQAAREVRVYIR